MRTLPWKLALALSRNRPAPPPRRPPRRALVAGIAAGLVAWAGSASAGPAVIAAARVEAFSAPSREARVVSELGQGAPICVLDSSNYSGVLLARAGWLAIRLPGGVGYVPAETVDLAAKAPEVTNCGSTVPTAPVPDGAAGPDPVAVPDGPAPAPVANGPAPAPVLRAGAAPIAAFPRQSGAPVAAFPRTAAGEATTAGDRPILLPGGFLPLRPVRFLLGAGAGMQWLDSQTAAANQIGDAGPAFNGTLGLTFYDIVMVSTTVSFALVSDSASFSQEVVAEMGGGDPHSADSSLTVASYSLAAGLRTPWWALGSVEDGDGWAGTALFAQLGAAGVTGTRAISNCVDCREDHLAISGGTFVRVGVDLFLPARKPPAGYGVTVAFDHYVSAAGLSDELRISLSLWL